MSQARQGLSVCWNDGGHGAVGRLVPPDVKAWGKRLHRFRLDRSFPVFTHCSDDRDPGNGDPTDGDIVGWINRGLDWTDPVDTPREYALTVLASYPGLKLPITVDVTPRRIQHFKLKPGDTVVAHVGGVPPREIRVDDAGLITVRGIRIANAQGTRVRLTH
jgi:hypothetical protein